MDPIRKLLLAVIHLGIVGLLAELLLLGHTESTFQWVPIVSLGLGLAAALAVALRPGPGVVRAFRGVMGLFLLAGAVGVYLHLDGNYEWALERSSSLAGWELFVEAITGATPVLAPGALAQLGLLGLVLTFRHPALGPGRSAPGAGSPRSGWS